MLGAGPGGYTAAFRAADLGLKTIMIERYEKLGGVCLNVGCIPSKALLHAARVISEADEMATRGIKFGKPTLDLDALRSWKESVVDKLTKGLEGLAKQRKVEVIHGVAKFTGPNSLSVGDRTVTFDNCIIAAGSQSVPCRSSPTTSGSSTPRGRCCCPMCRSGYSSLAAGSSASRWRPCTTRSGRR